MSGKEILFENNATAEIYAAYRSQYGVELAQQVGFWVDVSGVHKDFYKVAVEDQADLASEENNDMFVQNASQVVNVNHIYEALQRCTIGWLNDSAGDDSITTMDAYTTSGLGIETNPGDSHAPGTEATAGEHILRGMVNAAFGEGEYGVLLIDDSNIEALIRDSGEAYSSTSPTIDSQVATGLANALTNATQAQHDNALRGLLNQLTNEEIIEDFSGNVTNGVAYSFYGGQKVWMKLALTININTAQTSANNGGADAFSNGGGTPIITSYLGDTTEKLTVGDVNSTFSALSGVVVNDDGTGQPSDNLTSIVVTMLVKLNVAA